MSPSAVHSSRKKHLSNQKLNVCFPSCPNCRVLVSFQVSQNPDNDGRCFVISYFPSNDMISIFENPTRNSGITSGKFLEKTRVRKPGSTVDNPQFYSPADFAIGATIRSNPSILILHAFVSQTHLDGYFCSNPTQSCFWQLQCDAFITLLFTRWENSLSSALFQFSVTAFCWLTRTCLYWHTWKPTQIIFRLRHWSLCAVS